MNLSYQNILVGIDGSSEAEWSLKKAIEIAKRNSANLIISHVVDTRSFATIETYDGKIMVERAKKYAQDLLEKYKKEAHDAGVENVELIVEYGSPKAIMTKTLTKKYNIDLIVCGASGLNAIERFLMGSVSTYIVQHARCDVLIVRTEKNN